MTDLSAKRQALSRLDTRLANGEITSEDYERLRDLLTSGLTIEQRAVLGVSPIAVSGSEVGRKVGPSGGRTRMPSMAELNLASGAVLLDQWRIVRELGRGGFGAVFEAEDIKLGRTLAVKVLDPSMAAKEELLARFRREVTLMRELAHERIVRVYDYREEAAEHLALITMEYVRGCSVREVLGLARASRELVPVPLALAIFEQTLEALAAAHAQGVIHRDVTPGNILLAGGTAAELMSDPECDPRVKLVDFGIAGLVERTELSAKSRVLGTAAYVAPEVLDPDAEITAGADVFGAGAVVYDLLTGKTPMGMGYRPVRARREDLPEAIGVILDAAVRPAAGDRPSATEALTALARGRTAARRAEDERQRAGALWANLAAALSRGGRSFAGRAGGALREVPSPRCDREPESPLSTIRSREGKGTRGELARQGQPSEDVRQFENYKAGRSDREDSLRKWHAAWTAAVTRTREAVEELRGVAPGGDEEVRSWRGLVVPPMVTGAVFAVLALVLVAIWLEGSRGWVFRPPPREVRSVPSAAPHTGQGATPAPATDEPALATLVIRSNFEGNIAWVDGRELGPTQQVVEVAPGSHVVWVMKKGCDAEERWVEVQAGERKTLNVDIACATPLPTRPAPAEPEVPSFWTDPAVGMRFRYIPGGSFEMGSPASERERKSDELQHRVALTRGYWMGETEVTQGQWRAVMKTNPSHFGSCGDDCPVERVRWFDAIDFANLLSRQAGLQECFRITDRSVSLVSLECGGYRLPTEAEWEYAARGGTATPFWTGSNLTTEQANHDGNFPYAGQEKGLFRGRTLAVKSFPANPWGLYDMHGNVSEWVWDRYGDYAPGMTFDPTGSRADFDRVVRGGGWNDDTSYCRSASRLAGSPGSRGSSLGFRLVRTADR